MTDCECGCSYVAGLPDDEAAHELLHREYSCGPELADVKQLNPFTSVADYPVVVVDRAVSRDKRRRMAAVAYVAQRSTPAFPAGYDGSISPGDEKMFIVIDGIRAVAVALTALDDVYWRFAWEDDGTARLVDRAAVTHERPKIGRIWVAKRYRRKRIASRLAQAVCDHFHSGLADIGWELPMTMEGTNLLRQLVPGQWWGCGDLDAVRTLDINFEVQQRAFSKGRSWSCEVGNLRQAITIC